MELHTNNNKWPQQIEKLKKMSKINTYRYALHLPRWRNDLLIHLCRRLNNRRLSCCNLVLKLWDHSCLLRLLLLLHWRWKHLLHLSQLLHHSLGGLQLHNLGLCSSLAQILVTNHTLTFNNLLAIAETIKVFFHHFYFTFIWISFYPFQKFWCSLSYKMNRVEHTLGQHPSAQILFVHHENINKHFYNEITKAWIMIKNHCKNLSCNP